MFFNRLLGPQAKPDHAESDGPNIKYEKLPWVRRDI